MIFVPQMEFISVITETPAGHTENYTYFISIYLSLKNHF